MYLSKTISKNANCFFNGQEKFNYDYIPICLYLIYSITFVFPDENEPKQLITLHMII